MDEPDPRASAEAPACYLHPDRQALLRCARCERPICADDAIEAPVGYQCPNCAEGGQPVRRMVDIVQQAPVTRGLVYVIGALFVVTLVSPVDLVNQFGLRPLILSPEVAATAPWATAVSGVIGEPWVIVTSAFLHANLMHVGFNGLLLWQLGHMLEPALGRSRYIALYATGLAGGAFGVVLLSWLTSVTGLGGTGIGNLLGGNPAQPTIGASGAVFGLMGAAMIGMRRRGIDPWKTTIGGLVVLNLVLTFVIPNISVGGHLGGLLAGALAGRLLFVERQRAAAATRLTWVVVIAMVAVTIALALPLPDLARGWLG